MLKVIDPSDQVHMAMLLTAPRHMTEGKGLWNIVGGALETVPKLRSAALVNFIVNFYLQDGLHAHGFGRPMAAAH